MKICFDLRALQIGHENRGIGMYIRSMLEHLPDDGNRYLLYVFDKSNPVEKLELKIRYELVTTPTINTIADSPSNIIGLLKLINHRFKPLKKYRPDIFIQPDFTLGIPRWRNTKTYVIGYDLIPLIFKNDYLPSVPHVWAHTAGKKAKVRAAFRSIYYQFKYRQHYKVYKRASKVFCISRNTKDSFSRILNIDPESLVSIPLAPVLPKTRPDYSIAKKIYKPYIFYVGGTDARKNIKDIVFAFNIARGRGCDIKLVLAGNEFKEVGKIPDLLGRNAIMDSPYNEDIVLAGFITNEQKLGLYKRALAFVSTSRYEGFGLPIVEAMASDCPVLAYDNSSIPEAAGNAARLIPTDNRVELAKAILELQDANYRNVLIKKGRQQAKNFSWQLYAEKFRSFFN